MQRNRWQLSQDELARAREREEQLQNQAAQAIDRAISVIDGKSQRLQENPEPAAGHVRLTFFETTQNWIVLLQTADKTQFRSVQAQINWDSPTALSQAFLKPFSSELKQAKRIEIQPWGQMNQIDVHALPLEGKPLIAYAPVTYPLGFDAGPAQKRRSDSGSYRRRPIGKSSKSTGPKLNLCASTSAKPSSTNSTI